MLRDTAGGVGWDLRTFIELENMFDARYMWTLFLFAHMLDATQLPLRGTCAILALNEYVGMSLFDFQRFDMFVLLVKNCFEFEFLPSKSV